MGPLEELKLHIDALAVAVDDNPKFFASVRHYIAQLQQLFSGSRVPTLAELQVLIAQVEAFWSHWRPSGDSGMYIPPRETADTDQAVQRMQKLLRDLASLKETEFRRLARPFLNAAEQTGTSPQEVVRQPCVFIGHGQSRLWATVKMFLEDDLGLATVAYESESRTGDSIIPILEKMLDQATFALMVLTGEDEGAPGEKRARQNVIHEAGLFQGRLGFRRAVLLIQDGTEDFSNVAGLQHIPFAGEKVNQTFYELQRVLKREHQIER